MIHSAPALALELSTLLYGAPRRPTESIPCCRKDVPVRGLCRMAKRNYARAPLAVGANLLPALCSCPV